MKKGVLAELQSTYDTGFLTSCMEIDELVNNFKERQDEFDNGGIFVEVYDNETVMNTDVNVSKIAACIRKYTIKGDVNKDLAVYLTCEVDILDTPVGRKLVNNNSSHSIKVYLLFDHIHKKFLIVDVDEWLFWIFMTKKEFSSIPFFIVGLLTGQKEVSDKISEEEIECNNPRCDDCVEGTYSSIDYYELKKECIEKDHKITLLRRKVEALEYLIYACIPPDDRRAD